MILGTKVAFFFLVSVGSGFHCLCRFSFYFHSVRSLNKTVQASSTLDQAT